MLRHLMLLCLFLLPFAGMAQTETLRKIEILGSADTEVVPDEIEFVIALRSYEQNGRKLTLEIMESQLLTAVKNAAIPKDRLVPEKNFTYQRFGDNKPSDDENLAQYGELVRPAGPMLVYYLRLPSFAKSEEVFTKLDKEGVAYVMVQDLKNAKINQYQKESQMQALKNAQEKARYLLQGLSLEPGDVLDVAEVSSTVVPSPTNRLVVYPMLSGMSEFEKNPRTLKVHSEIRVVFKIK